MTDIQNREDIEHMVNSFYDRVKVSDILGPIFGHLSDDDWARHLPRMYNFWDNWLFETGAYTGGMMWVHIETNQRHRLDWAHFEAWLALFFETVDTLFVGPRADFVKNKASELGQIMSAKLDYMNGQKA